jgi:hypothetical protein
MELGPIPAAGRETAPEVYPSAEGDAAATLNGDDARCANRQVEVAIMASATKRTLRFMVPPKG